MRFTPAVAEMREQVRLANQRAENLAGRIAQARRAIRSGQAPDLVMAILDGKAERPEPPGGSRVDDLTQSSTAGHRCQDCGEPAVVGFGATPKWLCQEHFEERTVNDLGRVRTAFRQVFGD